MRRYVILIGTLLFHFVTLSLVDSAVSHILRLLLNNQLMFKTSWLVCAVKQGVLCFTPVSLTPVGLPKPVAISANLLETCYEDVIFFHRLISSGGS